jgi:uracil phosphoribosyltransferase
VATVDLERAPGDTSACGAEYHPRVDVTVVDHPLAARLLTSLRDETTPPPVFRVLAKRLALVIVLEALRDLPTRRISVRTPLAKTDGFELEEVVAVPILRAGLGMLEATAELLPDIAVGYLGLERDEASLRPQSYYRKLPDVAGRHVLVLDPMLATGGSGTAACAAVKEGGPRSVRFACVVAAPEGIERMRADHPDVRIFTAAIDARLDEHGYIVPGLGDFGDRLFGT